MDKTGKYLYCSKCKKYPNRIDEYYNSFLENRQWNKEADCYELIGSDIGEPDKVVCSKCETELINK